MSIHISGIKYSKVECLLIVDWKRNKTASNTVHTYCQLLNNLFAITTEAWFGLPAAGLIAILSIPVFVLFDGIRRRSSLAASIFTCFYV